MKSIIYREITEDVRFLRVRITFENNSVAFLSLVGRLHPTKTIRNPYTNEKLFIDYEIIKADEILEDLLESDPKYLVDENGEYINTEVNKISRVKVVESGAKQKTLKLFDSFENLGDF